MTRSLVVGACLTGSLLGPSTAESATLLQWMFPRMAARRAAQRANSAWTTAYYVPTTACSTPSTANYAGSNCSTCAVPAQTGWAYRPQTQYRTVWSQVPVTSYRPVAAGGYAGVQPCTTYSWQARRVPYVTYRPIFAGVGNNACCGQNTTLAPVTSNYWTQFGSAGYSLPINRPAAIAPSCGSCGSCGTGTAADVAPSLVTPATTVQYPSATVGYPSAWQTVDSYPGSTVSTADPTTTGYAATDWQPVTDSAPSTSSFYPSGLDNGNGGSSASSSGQDYAGATDWRPVNEQDSPQQLQPVPANRRPTLQDDSGDEGRGMRTDQRYGDDRYRRPRPPLDEEFGRRDDMFRPTPSSPLARPSSAGEFERQPGSRAHFMQPIPDWDRREDWQEELKTHLEAPSGITASLDRSPAPTRWQAIPVRADASRMNKIQNAPVKPRQRDGWRAAR